MNRLSAISVVIVGLIAGCEQDIQTSVSRSLSEPAELAGVYAGTLPCSNCPGIDTQLWLRADRTFLMHQVYPASRQGDELDVGVFGRWAWDSNEGLVVLRSRGPGRRFEFSEGNRLDLTPGSSREHPLLADATSAGITDTVRLQGEYISPIGAEVFTECITGIEFQINDDAGHANLRRQHRLGNGPNDHALATIDARILPVETDGVFKDVLAVDRMIEVKPNGACNAPPLQ